MFNIKTRHNVQQNVSWNGPEGITEVILGTWLNLFWGAFLMIDSVFMGIPFLKLDLKAYLFIFPDLRVRIFFFPRFMGLLFRIFLEIIGGTLTL